jgi:hypothetical protein
MENRSVNIDGYATTVIDNNNDVAEKTITLFKEIGRGWNGNHQNMCGILRINNVRNGIIEYDFSDYKQNYTIEGTTYINTGLPNGIEVITYRNGREMKRENVLVSSDFNKIMGNSVIYTFNYEYSVDVEIKFMFSYGVRKYFLYKTPETCGCCCSKCSGGDKVYNYSSIYDYIDLKVTYNLSGTGGDLFHRVTSTFEEFEEIPGTHSFKREYDLGKIDFRMVDIGINENKAIDISFFDPLWDPSNEDASFGIENYEDGPCSRHRIIGTVLKEEIQEFRDHTKGELPETPYENIVVTEENIKNSDIFKRVAINSSISQLCNLNTYEIIDFAENNKTCDVFLKAYLIIDENKNVKLIIEYIFNLPNVNGSGNDRIRFKSKIDVGLNFKLN